MRHIWPVFLIAASVVVVFTGCGKTREEGRQRRLDTFREILPEEVLFQFDAIESEIDCDRVGALLSDARADDRDLDMRLDSIMHAELIDTFSDEEVIHFFWFYFAYAIEVGAVPEP